MVKIENAKRFTIRVLMATVAIVGVILSVPPAAYAESLLIIRTEYETLRLKEHLDDPWLTINHVPASDVRVSGSRITSVDTAGDLWVKDGKLGKWYNIYSDSARNYQYAASENMVVIYHGGE